MFVYYLIIETSSPHYDILVLNQDQGLENLAGETNYGHYLLEETIKLVEKETFDIPLAVKVAESKGDAIRKLKNKEADALVIIPEDFSDRFHNLILANDRTGISKVE